MLAKVDTLQTLPSCCRSGSKALQYAEASLAELRSTPEARKAFGDAVLQSMPALAEVRHSSGWQQPARQPQLLGYHTGSRLSADCSSTAVRACVHASPGSGAAWL